MIAKIINGKLSIGILSYPSPTYYYHKRRRSRFLVTLDELPSEVKVRKSTFPKFMDGGIGVLFTLRNSLADLGDVEVALNIGDKVITDTTPCSPEEIGTFKVHAFKKTLTEWANEKDIIILLFKMNELLPLLSNTSIAKSRLIVCTAKSGEPLVREKAQTLMLFCRRVGVSRTDKQSVGKIRAAVGGAMSQ